MQKWYPTLLDKSVLTPSFLHGVTNTGTRKYASRLWGRISRIIKTSIHTSRIPTILQTTSHDIHLSSPCRPPSRPHRYPQTIRQSPKITPSGSTSTNLPNWTMASIRLVIRVQSSRKHRLGRIYDPLQFGQSYPHRHPTS